MFCLCGKKKGKRKVQGVPQSQTAVLPRPQEEEETDKSKQAQTEHSFCDPLSILSCLFIISTSMFWSYNVSN